MAYCIWRSSGDHPASGDVPQDPNISLSHFISFSIWDKNESVDHVSSIPFSFSTTQLHLPMSIPSPAGMTKASLQELIKERGWTDEIESSYGESPNIRNLQEFVRMKRRSEELVDMSASSRLTTRKPSPSSASPPAVRSLRKRYLEELTPPSDTTFSTSMVSSNSFEEEMASAEAELQQERLKRVQAEVLIERTKRLKAEAEGKDLQSEIGKSPITQSIHQSSSTSISVNQHPYLTAPSVPTTTLTATQPTILGLDRLLESLASPESAIKASIYRLCQSPEAFQSISHSLNATKTQKEDARKGKFVPLAQFLRALHPQVPTPDELGGEGHSSQDAHSARVIAAAFQQFNPEAVLAAAVKAHSRTPKFKGFQDIITAFAGGLMPIACVNRPDRLLDYSLFLSEIIAQHATGRQHWPVLLHYIEQVRKQRQPIHEGPEWDKVRENHRLCSSTPSTTRSILDPSILSEANNIWHDPTLRNTLVEDFVELATITSLSSLQTPASISASQLYGVSSNSRTDIGTTDASQSTFPPGISSSTTTTTSKGVKAVLSNQEATFCRQRNICLKYFLNTCNGACGREHLTINDFKSRMSASRTPTLTNTAGASTNTTSANGVKKE